MAENYRTSRSNPASPSHVPRPLIRIYPWTESSGEECHDGAAVLSASSQSAVNLPDVCGIVFRAHPNLLLYRWTDFDASKSTRHTDGSAQRRRGCRSDCGDGQHCSRGVTGVRVEEEEWV